MKNLKLRAAVVLICLAFLLIFFFIFQYFAKSNRENFSKLEQYLLDIHKIERNYIVKIPIYKDYITPEKERSLRQYLFPKHIQAIQNRKAKVYLNEQAVKAGLSDGNLAALDEKWKTILFFYNVPKKYRFLSLDSAKALLALGQRFQKLLKEQYQSYDQVKFAVSSVLRPVDYQSDLERRNLNATSLSTHSYGESFDIFYDDFFVSLPELMDSSNSTSPQNTEEAGIVRFSKKMRNRLGFMMGQSLRRQFRSVLTEAVLQLQSEQKIYVILEQKQRCYHITAY